MDIEIDDIFDDIFDDMMSDIIKYTQKLTLLYVEDDKEARESSLAVFEEFFDTIVVAENGAEGLDKFEDNDIDLVITDINMPIMDGLLMCEKIRDINKDVKLILLTAFNELEYYERSLKLDIHGYLLKPINLAHLLTVLDKLVAEIKLKEQIQKHNNLLQQYQNAMDQNLIVSKTNPQGLITYVNDRFIETYGYSKDEVMGRSHNILKSDKNPQNIYEEIWDTIQTKQSTWSGLIGNKTKDGKISYSKTTISPIKDIDGTIIEYIALRQDVTELI